MRIAAKIPRAETGYFKKKLEPEIDGEKIQLVGEVDEIRKQPFLAGAAALVFPIDWPEPFGLVMIEAMACGTPVIAYRSGSVPEVVEDGVTGFIVDGEQQAIEAVEEVVLLDRRKGPRTVRGALWRGPDGARVRKPISRVGRSRRAPIVRGKDEARRIRQRSASFDRCRYVAGLHSLQKALPQFMYSDYD